jgi:hypothetical protein
MPTEEEQARQQRLERLMQDTSYGGASPESLGRPRREMPENLPVPPARKRSWWWVELWGEKRQIFKEGVWHLFIFAGLLGSLEGAHRLLKMSTISPERIDFLDAVHFYMYAVILVVFATSFIIKVFKSEFGESTDE